MFKRKVAAGIAVLMLAAPLVAHSQAQSFGSLLKSLTAPLTGDSAPRQAGGGGSFGAQATERYCRNLFSVASISGNSPPDESLISEEFNLTSRDFFDAASTALNSPGGYSSFAFPSPNFYRGEFETEKINVLYNLLLSYPSSQYAAALIAEARKTPGTPQFDSQVKADATVALAALHFVMQNRSRSPQRWRELMAGVQGEEHYTSYVVLSRLIASGQWGAKDLSRALILARDASGLPNKYRADDMRLKKVSPRHYQLTSNRTQFEILAENPSHPLYREFEQFLQAYRTNEALRMSPDAFPELKAQLGPGLLSIEKAANSAALQAAQLLGNAKEVANLRAQKASLESATRTRTTDTSDVNVNAGTLAVLAREMEKGKRLDDRQKEIFAAALSDAHESGDRAVAMMAPMMNSTMSLMMQRGIGAVPAILPYAMRLQAYSDSACSVIARLDHAAQITGVAKGPDQESRSALASLVAEK